MLISIFPLAISTGYVASYLATASNSKARTELAGALAKADLVIDKRSAEIERVARTAARDNLVTINLELSLDHPVRDYLVSISDTQFLDYLGFIDRDGKVRVGGRRSEEFGELVASIGKDDFLRTLSEGGIRFAASVPGEPSPRVVLGAIAPVYAEARYLMGYIVAGAELSSGAGRSSSGLLAEIRAAVGVPVLVVSEGKPSVYSEGDVFSLRFAVLGGGEFSSIADRGRERIAIDDDPFLFQFRALLDPNGRTAGFVGLGLREADFLVAMYNALYSFLLVFVVALFVSALFAFFFSRSVSRPVDAMLRGTRLIVQGDFDTVIPVLSGDEIGVLSQEFNEMSRRLGTSLGALREEVGERARAESEVKKLNEELELRIQERTAELSEANHELEETVSYLNATRDQLVEAEKLAALGQLVATIAHEVNTPLGAITSSNEDTLAYLEGLLTEAQPLFATLGPENRRAYDFLLEKALRPRSIETVAKGDRELRKSFAKVLEDSGAADPFGAADDLVEMGLTELPPIVLGALADGSGKGILETIQKVFWLVRAHHIIAIASDRAVTTIRALKNYAYVDMSAEKSDFSLREELESILTLYYGKIKPGVDLRRDYREDPCIRGRRDLLNQVWINLINNALQAMEYRGILEISIFSAAGGAIGISFADDGPVIPEEDRDKIFKPFFSTKKHGEGSGLGLSICRKIVEEHGGSIGFESLPGKTTFTVLLPILRAEGLSPIAGEGLARQAR